MKKVRLIQLLLTAIYLVALLLLTGELFGQGRLVMMRIFVLSAWAGFAGNLICAMVLFIGGKKAQKEQNAKK